MRKFIIASLLVLVPSLCMAQAQITGTTCPGSGCVDMNVGGQGTVGVQITGTWTGTITFQASLDGDNFVSILMTPTTSTTAVTTTTGNGMWSGAIGGFNIFRVAFTSGGTGTAVVSRRSINALKGTGAAGGGGGGSGTVTSIATTSPITGGTITTTGTIACATCAVTSGKLSQFASTSSSELAGVISDETGTGLLTFATSPTLTTPVLGAATATSIGIGGALQTNTALSITGTYNSVPVDDGNSGTADTIDWATGNTHISTLTGSVTYTFSNPPEGGRFILLINTGAGSFTVTWPGTVAWPGGVAPTITATASKVDVCTFIFNTSNNKYYGACSQNY